MMRWAAVAAVLSLSAALAGDGINLNSIAGVYKHRVVYDIYINDTVDPARYQAENILEIVRIDARTAYVRTHLEFDNAHICAMATTARVAPDGLYMQPHLYDTDKTCEMKLVVKGDKLVFDDFGHCGDFFCGARGAFDGMAFPLSARRPIRYMARLKASREYRDALAKLGGNAK